MEKSRNAYKILVGKPMGKRPLGRLRHRCEDNIKMDLSEIDIQDRVSPVQSSMAGLCECGEEPPGSINRY